MQKESINLKQELVGTVGPMVEQVTQALKAEGFGVLSRIDLHAKIDEKLGKKIPEVVILGACNPGLAFEAFSANPDVASLLPCNAVVRDVGGGKVSVELAKPTALMRLVGDAALIRMAEDADSRLERVLASLH